MTHYFISRLNLITYQLNLIITLLKPPLPSAELLQKQPEDEGYLSQTAAAKYLGIDASSIRRYVKKGKLPQNDDIKGHPRYKKSDLNKLKFYV